MAYRANLFDFGAVEGAAGGANAAINDAAFAAAVADPTALIEIEQGIYEISQTVKNCRNGKEFVGSGRPDVFGTDPDYMTSLQWWGPDGGLMWSNETVTPGKDLHGAAVRKITMNGRNVANACLADKAARRSLIEDVRVMNPKIVGLHFVKQPVGEGNLNVSYRPCVNRVSVNVNGSAYGIIADGVTFGQLTEPHVTHMNGIAYYWRNCDDIGVLHAGSSRGVGGTGISMMFDGAQGTPVFGVCVVGFHAGAHDGDVRIWSRGALARNNDILFIPGVDNKDGQPIFVIEEPSELYYNFVGRPDYSADPTLAKDKALRRMPKMLERSYP